MLTDGRTDGHTYIQTDRHSYVSRSLNSVDTHDHGTTNMRENSVYPDYQYIKDRFYLLKVALKIHHYKQYLGPLELMITRNH